MRHKVTRDTATMTEFTNASTNISTDSVYDNIMDAAFFINKYYLWVILAIGFPGNLATIVTILRMRTIGSFTLYIVLLAFVDNLAILVKIIIYQLYEHKVDVTNAGCRIVIFLGNFLGTFANWILVLMAMERLVAVRYPLKIKKYITCRKSFIAICAVGLVILCAYAPILWIYFFNEQQSLCDFNKDLSVQELLSILHWTNVSMFIFIPFVILAVCNLLIVLVIRKSFQPMNHRRGSHNEFVMGRSSYYLSIQRQITLMLFTSTMAFVLFIFPLCAFHVTDISWPVAPATRAYATKYLMHQIAFLMFDSTHAVNFYLYFFSAIKFRRHFLLMVTCSTNSGGAVILLNGYVKQGIQV